MIDAVIARLRADVTDLRQVEGAAAFAVIMERNALPQRTPAAYVVPTRLAGGKADDMAGMFRQEIAETVGVVLIVRPNDRLGAKGIEPIQQLKTATINALAGWRPGDELGPFVVRSGSMLSVKGGANVYQLEFAISDQLRITR